MQGGRGAEWSGIPGGKFSLGRLEAGSGYCVGAVVETRMGIREERDEVVHDGKRGRSTPSRGGLGGNGMRDVWVIGEGFFRGVGGVFDVSLSSALLNPGFPEKIFATLYVLIIFNSSKSVELDSEHIRRVEATNPC